MVPSLPDAAGIPAGAGEGGPPPVARCAPPAVPRARPASPATAPAPARAVEAGASGRSWAGTGSSRRRPAPPQQLSLRPPPAAVLAGLALLLVGQVAALTGLQPGAEPLRAGRLPVMAAPALSVDPEGPPPRRLRIERLDVEGDLVALRTGRDGVLQVPADADVPGWYRQGVVPGDVGPAVVVGHVDSFRGPAVFHRLRELVPGDRVAVERVDGSVIDFEVYGLETVPKDGFPTERVYGPTEGSELRLITCGGSFDEGARSYTENVVVYARLLPPPAAS